VNVNPDKVLSFLQRRVLRGLFTAEDCPADIRLAGGTALSAFYLQHRLSFDLDLFTGEEGEFRAGEHWVEDTLQRLGVRHRIVQRTPHLLNWEGEEDPFLRRPLRIQLVREPGEILRSPILHGPIRVESMLDLGVEKLAALSDRRELKQYVDLYFLGRRPGYRVVDLVCFLEKKQTGIHPLMLAVELEDVSKALALWESFRPWLLVADPGPAEIEGYFVEEAERIRDIAEGETGGPSI